MFALPIALVICAAAAWDAFRRWLQFQSSKLTDSKRIVHLQTEIDKGNEARVKLVKIVGEHYVQFDERYTAMDDKLSLIATAKVTEVRPRRVFGSAGTPR